MDFFSTGSRDPGGTIILFEWDFNYTGNPAQFNPTSNGPTTSFTYFQPGRYFAALRETDDKGQSAIDFLLIDVSQGNAQAPTADAKASQGQAGPWSDGPIGARIGQVIYFQGNGAPTTGKFVTFFWDFNEMINNQEQTSTFQNPFYVFQTPGNHFVKLTVTDDQNLSSTDIVTITVTSLGQNTPPNAYAEVSTDGINYNKGPVSIQINSQLYFRAQQLPQAQPPLHPDPCWGPPMQNCDNEDKANVQFRWDFGDGSSSTQESATHTFGATGNRTVILTVTDTQNAPGTDTITVNVYNPLAPTADAKASKDGTNFADYTAASPLSGPSPLTVYFKGIGTDPRGETLTYLWNFGDGSTSTAQNPTHTFVRSPGQNRFVVSLTATNTDGLSGSEPNPVVVIASAPPVAIFIAKVPSTTGNEVVTNADNPTVPVLEVNFDATGSYDPDNNGISTYKWDFCFDGNFGALNSAECPTQVNVAGKPTILNCNGAPITEVIDPSAGGANTAKPCFSYSNVGSHVVALEVFDPSGLSDIATTIITANGDKPPIAIITTTPASPSGVVTCAAAPCPVQFDGTKSSDPDGSVVAYDWDFCYNNGVFDPSDNDPSLGCPPPTTTDTGPVVSAVYTKKAIFTAALQVTDDGGKSTIATVIVNVGNIVDVPPVVNLITPNEAIFDPSQGTDVSVKFDSISCDPDKVGNQPCPPTGHPGIVAYKWDFGDGTNGPEATQANPTHKYDFSCVMNNCPGNPNFLAANFHVTLTVTDAENTTGTLTETVIISPFTVVSNQTGYFPVVAPDFTVRKEDGSTSFDLKSDGGIGINVISMQFCLLSSGGGPTGNMPAVCTRNDGVFNTVYANKTGQNPLYANFQQYFVSEDGFTGAQVNQWRGLHSLQVQYPILIDIFGAGNRFVALTAYTSPSPPFSGLYDPTPPPAGNGLPIVTLIDYNGLARFWGQGAQGGVISLGIPIPNTNPPVIVTWQEVVEGFLKFFTPP